MYRHAMWLKNRMPNASRVWKIPFMTVFEEPPDLTDVRIPGCTAYSWIDPKLRKKLEPKSREVWADEKDNMSAASP